MATSSGSLIITAISTGSEVNVRHSPHVLSDSVINNQSSSRAPGTQSHGFEDRLVSDSWLQHPLLAVFDGHGTDRVSQFLAQRIFVELKGKLKAAEAEGVNLTDKVLDAILTSLFQEIDQAYYKQHVHPHVLKQNEINKKIPEGLNSWEIYQQYPGEASALEQLSSKIDGGSTAAVAIVMGNTIHLANCGDTRIVVGEIQDDTLTITQLSEDHIIANGSELKRLKELGLDSRQLESSGRVGPCENTRAFSDYCAKQGYQSVDVLQMATGQPIIVDPHTRHFSVESNNDRWFLMLMTDGVYNAAEQVAKSQKQNQTVDGNSYVAEMVLRACKDRIIPTEGIAQHVVSKLRSLHQRAFENGNKDVQTLCRKLDDMSLMVFFHSFPIVAEPKVREPLQRSSTNHRGTNSTQPVGQSPLAERRHNRPRTQVEPYRTSAAEKAPLLPNKDSQGGVDKGCCIIL